MWGVYSRYRRSTLVLPLGVDQTGEPSVNGAAIMKSGLSTYEDHGDARFLYKYFNMHSNLLIKFAAEIYSGISVNARSG